MSALTEASVLETLRRIPDRIILAVAARDLELLLGNSCLCGWFIRERLAEMRNVGASAVALCEPTSLRPIPGMPYGAEGCHGLFGGTWSEWDLIYFGVAEPADLPIIESAYVQRLDEAVFGRECAS